MKRFILSGTPGSGKTTVLRHLRHLRERDYATVEEAATAVIERELALGIAEPWMHPEFIDQIVTLQRERQSNASGCVQIYDRSPVCTYALSVFLGREPSALLRRELDRIARDAVYEPQVFFLCNLGFVEHTAARRISYEDSLVFEQVHRDSYRSFGYELVDIPVAPPAERAETISKLLSVLSSAL